MTTEKPTPSVQERMADLKETLKKEKVKLTPDVEQYIQEHVRAIQDKLQSGEDVYEEDLAFIGQVKLWVGMPEEWRKKYVSIREIQESEEQAEVANRHISLRQWLDLLHVADAKGADREWIDETFTFPGGGKIAVEGSLDLSFCTGLTCLPEGLEVGLNLDLKGCTSLTSLPKEFKIDGSLDLKGCTSLTSLPKEFKIDGSLDLKGCTSLTSLPEGLEVNWSLYLIGCTRLIFLPERMRIDANLDLTGCTGLTCLPEELEVGWDLLLSADCHEQVEKDAERLKVGGRIGGTIVYT